MSRSPSYPFRDPKPKRPHQQVVHLPDDDLHDQLKAYCKANRLHMKSFISGVIVAVTKFGLKP